MTIKGQATWAYSQYKNLLRAGNIESFSLMLAMAIKHWYPEERLGARDEIAVTMFKTIRKLHYKESEL